MAVDEQFWIKLTALGIEPTMQQCLAILLFHECSTLLERWEVTEWAGTETTLWREKRMEEQEHAERYREMVEDGWFSD